MTDDVASEIPLADGIKVYCAHDAIVPLDELRPNPRNPNKHPFAQIEMLAKVIKGNGWRLPITVSTRSGLMVRGHGRLEAAQLAGLGEVPIDRQHYDTDDAEFADLLADNRIPELSEIDRYMLKDVLGEIDTGAIDMDLTGYDYAAVEELMTAAPPPDGLNLGGGKGRGRSSAIVHTCPKCGHKFGAEQ